jgi:PAP2 superfamily
MFERYRLGYVLLLAFAALEFTIAFSVGDRPFHLYFMTDGFIDKMLPAWALLPLIWAGFLVVEMMRRQINRPLSALRRMLYRHRHWLGRGLLFMIVIVFLARGFSSFKANIPNYVPFFADPWLVEFDRALFGTDPWRLTHALIGPYGTMLIDRVYALWFVIMMLYLGWFCFSRNLVLQLRGLLSYVLCWFFLGNILALTFSSVGPCFYEHFYQNSHFSPLMDRLHATGDQYGLLAIGGMNFLKAVSGKDLFGAGISAMPSLHVAIAFLCFLVAWEYGRHWWAKLLGFLFFAVIAVGSVHLGWHYAVDGIMSVVVTGLIWWGTGRFVRWVEKREAAQAAPASEPLAVPAPA